MLWTQGQASLDDWQISLDDWQASLDDWRTSLEEWESSGSARACLKTVEDYLGRHLKGNIWVGDAHAQAMYMHSSTRVPRIDDQHLLHHGLLQMTALEKIRLAQAFLVTSFCLAWPCTLLLPEACLIVMELNGMSFLNRFSLKWDFECLI